MYISRIVASIMNYVYSANFKIIFRKHLEYSNITHVHTCIYILRVQNVFLIWFAHLYILHHVQMNLSVYILLIFTISQIEHNNAKKHHLLYLVAHFCIESLRSLIYIQAKTKKAATSYKGTLTLYCTFLNTMD